MYYEVRLLDSGYLSVLQYALILTRPINMWALITVE